jgi:plastocyanin
MGVIVFHGPFHKINKVEATVTGKTVTVKIVTDPQTTGRYNPSPVTVKAGDTVLFVNVSNAPHTVTRSTFDSGNISTGNGRFKYRFLKAGTFSYYCTYHPGMKGSVVVKA